MSCLRLPDPAKVPGIDAVIGIVSAANLRQTALPPELTRARELP